MNTRAMPAKIDSEKSPTTSKKLTTVRTTPTTSMTRTTTTTRRRRGDHEELPREDLEPGHHLEPTRSPGNSRSLQVLPDSGRPKCFTPPQYWRRIQEA